MKEGPDIAATAALIGDPARANMLTALLSGKALTATELAQEAGVTLQTASGHLSKLDGGGLLQHRKQGRHKYFALASDDVAHVLEGLMGLAASSGHARIRTGPKDAALRKARVCYNHLAGDMGVQLYESLTRNGLIAERGIAEQRGHPALTDAGHDAMLAFGIDLPALQKSRAPLCRACLDWSERRTHLAGSLGRSLYTRFEELGWAKRDQDTRVVVFTRAGERAFAEQFK